VKAVNLEERVKEGEVFSKVRLKNSTREKSVSLITPGDMTSSTPKTVLRAPALEVKAVLRAAALAAKADPSASALMVPAAPLALQSRKDILPKPTSPPRLWRSKGMISAKR
jgi:hypothetical protein